ncbi:MAG: DUF4175 family protein [Alphaproteobacteria bacterium]|nr:DUF4175 family protein [Alphaproteobacteria bacterium]
MPPDLQPLPPPPSPGATADGAPGDAATARDALRDVLAGLVRRERRQLLLRSGLQLIGVGLATGLLAAVLVSRGVGRDASLGAVAALLVVGGVAALAVPLFLRWRATGDLLRQARGVEAVEPALRSRLLTAVDRALLPDAQAGADEAGTVRLPLSQALLDRAVRRAAALAGAVPPDRVHPSRVLKQTALAVAVVALITGIAGWRLPVGPLSALTALVTGDVAAARLADAVVAGQETAVVGDITLRYVFPDHTRMAPVEIPNSDGTIHAPPGTTVEIRARTGEPFDAVAVQIDDGAPIDAVLRQQRDVSAQLVVQDSGTWRFLLFRGGEVVQSPTYRIEVEDDAAPVITVEAEAVQVGVDQDIGLRWAVQDDFGVTQVELEITRADGTVERRTLRRPLDPARNLDGVLRIRPQELGLRPGEEATLRIVARDNDGTASGADGTPGKEAMSAEIPLEVVGPRSAGKQHARYYRALRDAMVLALADFLVESDDLPIANDPQAMQRWVADARTRFDDIEALYDKQYSGQQADTLDGDHVRGVLEDAARLLRFTMTTFDPSTSRRVTMTDLETFDTLHDKQIDSLERAIYVLDKVIQAAAWADAGEVAQEVAQEARELADLAQDAEAAELLAALDQLERLMSKLAQTAAQLGEGQLKEFLNREIQQSALVMDEIRKAIAEGRMDDARKMLEALAEQLDQMSNSMQEQMASGKQQADEAMQKLDETMSALEQLEQQQRDLAQEIGQAQQSEGSEFQEQLELWAELDRLAGQLVTQGGQAVSAAGDGEGWRVESIRRAENVERHAQGVQDAVRARDPATGLERSEAARWRLEQAQRAVRNEAERPRLAGETVPAGVPAAEEALREGGRTLGRIDELLRKLSSSQQQTSPEMQQLARELSSQQEQLNQQQQQLQKDVRDIERQLPGSEGKATEAMQQAGDAMQSAGEQLSQGEPVPGQGHMQEGADRLGAARDELQRQQQQLQQMQAAQQQMRGQGGQQGSGQNPGQRDQGDSEGQQERVELPNPEAFQTPEEYRKALLEGMEADVPEEYEALKKQYYEELVRQ